MESGLKFWVNLEAYLDTGLFPDHRRMRALVRDRASGKRVLNLFGYTGSFTVYATVTQPIVPFAEDPFTQYDPTFSTLQFTNIGFGHPRVVAAIQEQAALLATVAPQHANAARSEAARLIVERAPSDQDGERFTHVFFTASQSIVLRSLSTET